MSWRYRLRIRITEQGYKFYDVVEFFRIGKKTGWTMESMSPGGESKKEVIEELEMMLRDVKRGKPFYEKKLEDKCKK